MTSVEPMSWDNELAGFTLARGGNSGRAMVLQRRIVFRLGCFHLDTRLQTSDSPRPSTTKEFGFTYSTYISGLVRNLTRSVVQVCHPAGVAVFAETAVRVAGPHRAW